MKKPTAKRAVLNMAKRLVHPRHTLGFIRCFKRRKTCRQDIDDAQLKLYAEILPGDFLNYGFYDDPSLPPEQLSLQDIQEAQIRYGQLLIDAIRERSQPVLDVGCGMGGLLNLLVEQEYSVVALTPNGSQAQYIRSGHPDVPLLEGTFESIPLPKYRHYFGTVITSESFQYIKLAKGLDRINQVLAPGGRWILCDYFRTRATRRRSGHDWDDFMRAVTARGWMVLRARDITPHVLPTVRYVHMLGKRVAVPMANFLVGKFRKKRPALHYLLDEVIEEFRAYLLDQLEIMNPETFAREMKYMHLVMERP